METADLISMITALIDSLGTVGILIWFVPQERRRADDVTSEIIADWKRQNDRELDVKQVSG